MSRTDLDQLIREHQPGRWWMLLGLTRCRAGCGRWPCARWHLAQDQRQQRAAEREAALAVARMMESLRAQALAAFEPRAAR